MRYLLLLAVLLFSLDNMAQEEVIPVRYIYPVNVNTYLSKLNSGDKVYNEVFKGECIQKENAVRAGWDGFFGMYGLASIPIGFTDEVFGPNVLKRINKGMGHIGNGLALTQIAIDIRNGDFFAAETNAIKTSAYYAISEWGWKGLKIGAFGMQFIDYSLTTFGTELISMKKSAWHSAYFTYYDKESGVYRNLKQWREVFKDVKSSEEIEEIIKEYLKRFWNEDNPLQYADNTGRSNLFTQSELSAEDKLELEKSYLNERLLPYLRPLFLKLPDLERKEKAKAMVEECKKLAVEFNKKNDVIVKPLDGKKYPGEIDVCIRAKMNGEKGSFMIKSVDQHGGAVFEFTRYSLLKREVENAVLVVRNKTEKGKRYFKQKIDLKKNRNSVYYTFKDYDDKKKEEDAPDVKEEEPEVEAPEIVAEPEPEPEEKQPIVNESPVFVDNMEAMLKVKGSKAMNVKLVKLSDSATEYKAIIKHKRFPKLNELVYDKVNNVVTISYKLKGRWAPWLICTSLTCKEGVYSGLIKTKDKHNREIGAFTFKIL